MKKIVLTSVFWLFSLVVFSQNIIKESLFEGKVGQKSFQLYIQTRNDNAGCLGFNNYTAMLKYNETDEWIYLEVYANENNSFLFVDGAVGRYSSMIQVKQKGKVMTGFLYDTHHYSSNVFLEKNTTVVDFEPYRNAYEEVHYLNHDC